MILCHAKTQNTLFLSGIVLAGAYFSGWTSGTSSSTVDSFPSSPYLCARSVGACRHTNIAHESSAYLQTHTHTKWTGYSKTASTKNVMRAFVISCVEFALPDSVVVHCVSSLCQSTVRGDQQIMSRNRRPAAPLHAILDMNRKYGWQREFPTEFFHNFQTSSNQERFNALVFDFCI